MTVSIIIPVYKVEQYIYRCIESVLNQTYRQLEVILVDDCSPDGSMETVKKLINESSKSTDLRFKYLRHECNRGLSAARNTGLDAAKGDYIFFLDSDDEIVPNCIETLVSGSEDGKIDVICGGLEYCGSVELFGSDSNFNCRDAYYIGEKAISKAFVAGLIPYSAWNKLLRRDVLCKEKVSFKEGLLFEDNLWIFILINSVKQIKTISKKTYRYWIRPGSIATSTDHLKRRQNMSVVLLERDKFLIEKGISNKIIKNYLTKDEARWIQECLFDKRIPIKEKLRLFSIVFSFNYKYGVIGYCSLFSIRRVLYQIKILICPCK